jgi:hypothetical protein
MSSMPTIMTVFMCNSRHAGYLRYALASPRDMTYLQTELIFLPLLRVYLDAWNILLVGGMPVDASSGSDIALINLQGSNLGR